MLEMFAKQCLDRLGFRSPFRFPNWAIACHWICLSTHSQILLAVRRSELWLAIAERDFRRWLSPEMGSLARNVRVTFEKLKPTTTRE